MKLIAQNISKQYFRQTKNSNYFNALNETNFTLPQGKLVEIEGRSGSGKSTFLNIMSGLLKPTTGTIIFKDEKTNVQKEIYKMNDTELSKFRNKNFAVIPQGQSGLNALTVLENVKLPALIYGADSEEITNRANELLQKMGIADLAEEKPFNLSGGEMRRMAISRALITKPAFIFADEPTSDLDDENTKNVLSLLKQIASEGTGVLLVTHETDAANYADIVYKMNAGTLSQLR